VPIGYYHLKDRQKIKPMDLRSKYNNVSEFLMRPIDPSTLGAFRIFFGLLMLCSTIDVYRRGWIHKYYLKPEFFFPFEMFPWVTPWPGDGMYYHFAIMALAALFLALGLFYRLAAITFFLTYTFTFLIDKTNYNNHYYFICLISLLLCFINAHHWMALDNLWKKKFCKKSDNGNVSRWNIFIIQFQIFIVYFYGGIAKINFDWLNGEPMRHWLKYSAGQENTPPIVAQFLESEIGVYFFSYGGLIFDLAIGFLLIYRKTRLLAFGLLLVFNISNHWMFKIGVFPFLMVFATVIFLEPETPRKFVQKYFSKLKYKNVELNPSSKIYRIPVVGLVSLYIIIQVLLPFRHWLYQGNVSWTEEGHNFAWRMKIRSKEKCGLRFIATNPETGEKWPILAENHLVGNQYPNMCKKPHMLIYYAHYLKDKLKETGINNPIITATTFVSLNYRPLQPIVDPNLNLANEEYSIFKHADWILPLKE
jgi:vitamin K-dependent gamma-carboxylase